MQKGALSKQIGTFPAMEANREKLVAMFESMKTSTKTDRFQYIRQWYGTDEVQPVDLTAGLAHQKTDTSTNTEVLLAASSELKETIKDGAKVRDGL